MSHGLDTTTGQAAMAYAGQTPWHGLGQELPLGRPIEEWVKAARLDWELQRLPVQYRAESQLRTMNDRFVLARSDNHHALSVVSGDYNVVQPKEVMEFYRDLVSLGGYVLETAGALNEGRKVWALARTKFDSKLSKDGKDELRAYLLLATSCDKTLATTVAFTSVRVVCQNTLNMVIKEDGRGPRRHLKVPHSKKFDADAVKAELGLLQPTWNGFLSDVNKLAEFKVNQHLASSMIAELLRSKPDEALSPRAQREHATILSMFKSAPGQELLTSKETGWGLVNAVTYYADHVRAGSRDKRLDSAWFGTSAALKDKAWMAISAAANLQAN
jgi:phage/plasmid-like protein (TIGR03299 family)